jgi:MerR family transcriptional regulator, repressor of the yfmOP operon
MTNAEMENALQRIATLSESNTLNIAKHEAESKKWDKRFFQLSRDTLNFSRNIIVTAAVVAVVAPLLPKSLTFALELLKQQR